MSSIAVGQQLWTNVLAPARAINWTTAGAGTIPNRTTVCTTLNPGATAAQITAAISACPSGDVVMLSAGTYNLTTGIRFNDVRNVTLRGAGANQTFLVFSSYDACGGIFASVCFINGDPDYRGGPSNTANWTAGYAQGTTQITLDNTANLKVGTALILDQLQDSSDDGTIYTQQIKGVTGTSLGTCLMCDNPDRTNRDQEQIVTVTGISGNTVTISPGIYMPNWRSSQTPGAWWSNDTQITGDGVENLSIDNTSDTSGINAITFYNAANDWVTGVRSVDPKNHHVEFWQANHNTISNNYFWGTQGSGSDAAQESYGVEWYLASDNLVVNNIFQNIPNPNLIAMSEGDVVAYNYALDHSFGSQHDWMMQGDYTHAPGTNYILFEGNVDTGMQLEDYHGMAFFATAFRNRYTGYEPKPSPANLEQTVPIMIQAFAGYSNLIGNVLGTSGFHTSYQNNSNQTANTTTCYHSIYTYGWGGNCAPGDLTVHPVQDDTVRLPSHMRWGNFDVVNNSNQFNSSEVPSTIAKYSNPVPTSNALPASFFLSAAPAWWPSSKPWPAIGPDVSGGNISVCSGGSYSGMQATAASQCGGGTLASAGLNGEANSIPAMDCYLNTMNGPADGSGSALTFNASSCYGSASGVTSPAPPPPSNNPPPAPTGLAATVS